LNSPLVECVPNFAEGRDPARIEALLAAIGTVPHSTVLHVTSDTDHNRTVITFAGPPRSVLESAVRVARRASEIIDLRTADGVHPRLGALDVLPFVPLDGSTLQDCVELAHEAGHRIWHETGVPVYFYEAAALRPDRRKLEDVRRGEFELLRTAVLTDKAKHPDIGGPELHPTAGAVIVGARKFLIAYNVNLRTDDLSIARNIARSIRTSSGGLPAVKALGLSLASRGLVQVSMNLTDFETTPLDIVFSEIVRLAKQHGVEVEESELIGLAPRKAIEMAAARFLKLKDFDTERVIENRLASTEYVRNNR
jgi:glutamate formiminotransferase